MPFMVSKTIAVVIAAASIGRLLYSILCLPNEVSGGTIILLAITGPAYGLFLATWRKKEDGKRPSVLATLLAGTTAIAMFDVYVQSQDSDSKILRAVFYLLPCFTIPMVRFIYSEFCKGFDQQLENQIKSAE